MESERPHFLRVIAVRMASGFLGLVVFYYLALGPIIYFETRSIKEKRESFAILKVIYYRLPDYIEKPLFKPLYAYCVWWTKLAERHVAQEEERIRDQQIKESEEQSAKELREFDRVVKTPAAVPPEEPQLAARYIAWLKAREPSEALGEFDVLTLNGVRTLLVPSIQGAASITFFSLLPSDWPTDEAKKDPKRFHGYVVLGSVEISKAEELRAWRKRLLEAVKTGAAVGVFYPHYGIRLNGPEGHIDIVACFETSQWWLFGPGFEEHTPAHAAALDRSVRDALDQLFDAKKIPRDATRLFEKKPDALTPSTPVPP